MGSGQSAVDWPGVWPTRSNTNNTWMPPTNHFGATVTVAETCRLARRSLFTGWFLNVMLNQIRFTQAMFDLDALRDRYTRLIAYIYPGNDRLPLLVAHVLRRGEMTRGDARFVIGASERTTSSDLSGGFLKSAAQKGPVRIAFPLDYRERLFPNLFTDTAPDVPVPRAPPVL